MGRLTDGPPVTTTLSSGDLFGAYLVVQPIGRQAARNYVVLDPSQGSERVLLVEASDRAGEATFRADLEVARGLEAGAIPRVLDGGVRDGRCFLVSEWVPGVTLEALLEQHVPMDPEVGVRLVWRLAQRLAMLHEAGLVHGDVHPRNILLDGHGEVHLAGWAPRPFARPLPGPGPEDSVRRYAAPECNVGEPAGVAADLYPLGLMLYEVLVGRPLLAPGPAHAVHMQQIKLGTVLDKVARLANRIPDSLDPLIRMLLRVDPEDRPRTARAVLAHLIYNYRSWSARPSLLELMGKPYRVALARTRKALVDRARDHLEEDQPLASASALRHFGELTCDEDPGTREECADLVRHGLWRTFGLRTPAGGDIPGALYQQGLALQLLRASRGLGSRTLRQVAGSRLRALALPGSPLARLAPPSPPPAARAEQRKKLLAWISAKPWDEQALLCLADASDDFHPDPDASVAQMQAAVALSVDDPVAALHYRSKDLLTGAPNLRMLRDLQGLLGKALELRPSVAPPGPVVGAGAANPTPPPGPASPRTRPPVEPPSVPPKRTDTDATDALLNAIFDAALETSGEATSGVTSGIRDEASSEVQNRTSGIHHNLTPSDVQSR